MRLPLGALQLCSCIHIPTQEIKWLVKQDQLLAFSEKINMLVSYSTLWIQESSVSGSVPSWELAVLPWNLDGIHWDGAHVLLSGPFIKITERASQLITYPRKWQLNVCLCFSLFICIFDFHRSLSSISYESIKVVSCWMFSVNLPN